MFRQTWFLVYDLIVVALCALAIVVALAPVRSWGRVIPRWMLITAAWIACAMLLFRGLLGMIVDGSADLVWWPTFLTGGILFRGVARSVMANRRRDETPESPEETLRNRDETRETLIETKREGG